MKYEWFDDLKNTISPENKQLFATIVGMLLSLSWKVWIVVLILLLIIF